MLILQNPKDEYLQDLYPKNIGLRIQQNHYRYISSYAYRVGILYRQTSESE